MNRTDNTTRRTTADREDEILELLQAQHLDDSVEFAAWGPTDRVYRCPGVESWVELIGGGEVEVDEDEEIDEDDSFETELEARTAEDAMWDGRYWKAFRSELKLRPAPVVHLPAPKTEIPNVAVLIEPGPMSSPCCRFAGKKHYHHKCTQCGGLATAKKMLDVSLPIVCSNCYEINKHAAAAK